MMNKKIKCYQILYLLFLGSMIYILFREPVIFTKPLLFLFDSLPLISLPDKLICNVIKYYLPDILWCLAVTLYSLNAPNLFSRIATILLPIIMEISQLYDIIPGTFDLIDITIYITIATITLLWKIRNQRKQCSLTF